MTFLVNTVEFSLKVDIDHPTSVNLHPRQKLSMDNRFHEQQQIPSGILAGIDFDILTEDDTERIAAIQIDTLNQITDAKLGLPNLSLECFTCGTTFPKFCDGHFGVIKFPVTVLHPYFLSEVAQILNLVCPGCKSCRHDLGKVRALTSSLCATKECKYCAGFSNDWYPRMKFKVSSKDLFHKTSIIVEVGENLPKKYRNKGFCGAIAPDYWEFIPNDAQHNECWSISDRRILSHAQVHHLLRDIDPLIIRKLVRRSNLLFLNSFLVTPNCHRVTEIAHTNSNRKHLIFDDRTRAYRKLVDFRGLPNELGIRFLECMKISKLVSEKTSNGEDPSRASGSKWFKQVLLGKRTDHSFRMVVVGDPSIGLNEIGIPCCIAERLLVSEQLNSLNWKRLISLCHLCLIEKGKMHVFRSGSLTCIYSTDEFDMGDIIYRPLSTGDIVLINRPPSIHQHSLIALYANVLPINSVMSINPICCLPLCGDFDGDCLHGYVPQSVDSRVELLELMSLKQQLINEQTGRNLLSYSQDTLVAVYLLLNANVFFDHYQIQQLSMFCHRPLPFPAIVMASPRSSNLWTGKQLFSMLLPLDFNCSSPKDDVYITGGELLVSNGSAWICDTVGGYPDLLNASQQVFVEWLSSRGLSVSLSDLYLCDNSYTRRNLIDEVSCGLGEAVKACHIQQFFGEPFVDFLLGEFDVEKIDMFLDMKYLSDRMQRFVSVCQGSIRAFKKVFCDIQSLAYQYVDRGNSLMMMLKSGSKGSLSRLVQQSMCIGLQHSLVPLSFKMPEFLSCASWNKQKVIEIQKKCDDRCAQDFIPCGVVQNSFLTGMNPLECFIHSLASRDSSFSDNADLPGTLNKKLMFFMRDLYVAYDGTVRSSYSNQVIQFSCGIQRDASASCGTQNFYNWKAVDHHFVGGCPVGSLSACALSEAAYSALDQPISVVDISPLLNLKRILEYGGGGYSATQTASIFLSKQLGLWAYGFEHGALVIKNHLERVLFSDIVSNVFITFSPWIVHQAQFSPWVCHFHLCEESLKRKNLKINCVIDTLQLKYGFTAVPLKIHLPQLFFSSWNCVIGDRQSREKTCIMVTMPELRNSSNQLDMLRDDVMPILLKTVIKGFFEVKKVDILWKDMPKISASNRPPGELYVKIHMAENCDRKFWNILVNNCLEVMELIDWERSHPDDARGICLVYGLDSAFNYFIHNMKSAVSDIGKAILPEHLLLVANCLSCTGEFPGLNPKGLIRQREEFCISSPFNLASFSAPGSALVKAAKSAKTDYLQGSVDALAWGKIPCIGTAGKFDILYSGKGHEIEKPENVYGMLIQQPHHVKCKERNKDFHSYKDILTNSHAKTSTSSSRQHKNLEMSRSSIRSSISVNDIQTLTRDLKAILRRYEIDQHVCEKDRATVMKALHFHPRKDEKIGSGILDIKVGYHTEYKDSRCFFLVRKDGTVEDFSYRKCVLGALQIVAPSKAKSHQSMWSRDGLI